MKRKRFEGGPEPSAFLSEDQKKILDYCLESRNNNCLVTGVAGTGKSFLLRALVEASIDRKLQIEVTASTGTAALNAGGRTIHSCCGIGLGDDVVDLLIEKVRKNRTAYKRLCSCQMLIIDEISLIDRELFDKLNTLLKKIRRDDSAFGGLQVIMFGDFLQLPPVKKSGFCFLSEAWTELNPKILNLTKVFRQEDQTFVDCLNEIRTNQISEKTKKLIESRIVTELPKDRISVTQLTCLRSDAASINDKSLKSLDGPEYEFKAKDEGKPEHLEFMKRNCQALDVLKLRKGALVVLLKNKHDLNLVNGSVGRVISFLTFEPPSNKIEAYIKSKESEKLYPLVLFENGLSILITPEKFSMRLNGKDVASRTQLPLQLGWALTIHKNQGMTLDSAVVRIDDLFEAGQGYVALSRVKSLDNLYILSKTNSINWNGFRADQSAIQFYAKQ